MSNVISFRALRLLLAGTAAGLLLHPVGSFGQTSSPPARPSQPPVAKQRAAPPVSHTPTVPAPTATPPAVLSTAPVRATDGDEVVARVGNVNVSASEVRAFVGALGAREQAALGKDPALLSQVVRTLLTNRLVLQEIAAKKWDQQAEITAQLERVRQNALVELYLQSVAAPPESFPSDDELQKVYEANRGALLMPRQFELAQIFIPLQNDADKAAQDKARQALEEVQRKLKAPGADFSAIARATNEAKDGGDLGWLAEPQIKPEIRAQVIGLAKNAVAEPIRLEDGWHILKLIDTKAAYTRTLPEVREQLVQQMRAERAAQLRRAYVAELMRQNPPVLNELALSGLLDNSHK